MPNPLGAGIRQGVQLAEVLPFLEISSFTQVSQSVGVATQLPGHVLGFYPSLVRYVLRHGSIVQVADNVWRAVRPAPSTSPWLRRQPE